MSDQLEYELTPLEHELLTMLAEEAAEVVQAVAKIIRHGPDSCHPSEPEASNRVLLMDELGDMEAVGALIGRHTTVLRGVSPRRGLADRVLAKTKYMHHLPALESPVAFTNEEEAVFRRHPTRDLGARAVDDDAWRDFEGDFNAMTDAQVEAETVVAQNHVDENEAWLEAVASWEAAGRPRSTDA